MNSKLEEKLQEINQNDPITNDVDLMNALEKIIDAETKKPIEEMDTELVDSAVEFTLSVMGLDLEKVEAASEKHVEDYLSKFHKEVVENGEIKPKKKMKKPFKYLLAIAAVLAAMTVTVVATCIALDFDFMDLKTFLGLEREVEHNDGDYSLTINEALNNYSSLESFIANESTDGLLLPSDDVNKISVIYNKNEKRIIFTLNIDNSTFEIECFSQQEFENYDSIKIGEYDVLVVDMKDQIQGVWIYKDNCYYVKTTSFEQLTNIINNLKEY